MITQDLTVGYHIGFANEFYTLWSVGSANERGLQQADFCGNISKVKADVVTKYPDYPFSALKGYTWEKGGDFLRDDGTSETFVFGKYSGQAISDSTDFGYLTWYWGETKNLAALMVLTAAGYVIYDDRLFESQAEANAAIQAYKLRGLLFDGAHEITFVSNLNQSRQIRVMSDVDGFEEAYSFGQELDVSGAVYSDFVGRSYKGHVYYVMAGVRSMKGLEATIETKDGTILSIDFK